MRTLDDRLLNEFQRGFPLVPRPYHAIATQLGVIEVEVIAALERLAARGTVSRVGAVFAPGPIGAATLAALAVPASRLAEVAAQVNAHPEVNHNYEREHHFNLWFVVTASDRARVLAVLREIESAAQCGPPLDLPMIAGYHIDLGFDLEGERGRAPRPVERVSRTLSAAERGLVAALQQGLALVPQPYAQIGRPAGFSERDTIAMIERWLGTGVLKRLGVIVRHH